MTFRRFLTPLIALVMAAFATAPASAVPLNVDITGFYEASFAIDSNPTPSFSNNNLFRLDGIPVLSAGNPFSADIYFDTLGRLTIWQGNSLLFDGRGAFLFNGTTSAPQIKTGVFQLITRVSSGGGVKTEKSSISITAAVPLPAALPMLAVGLAGLVFMARKRRAARA